MAREIKGVANLTQTKQTKQVEKVDKIEEVTAVPALDQNEINKTVDDVAKELKKDYLKKQSKPTMEQTHIRTTFLLDRDLNNKLNKLSKKYGRGFKTEFLNKAIAELLERFWEEIEMF